MALDLQKLNPAQREAVLHGTGPMLILAGAGSGKTSTMAHRMALLIADRGVSPTRILGLSFTNKAAHELKDRVSKLVAGAKGKRATKGLLITTFHSLCVRLLRIHAGRLGYQTNFSILDSQDQVDLVRQILKNVRIDDRKFAPEMILSKISSAKNLFLSPEEAQAHFLQESGPGKLPDDYQIAISSVYPRYIEALRLQNAMDFDDLIFLAVRLLEENEDVRIKCGEKFLHILVDEYQDTNQAQFRLLEGLLGPHKNICVVGDDDQSIYAWRGADPEHILGFEKHYEGAKRIILDQNYRSTQTILDSANEVISKNANRFEKRLWSDKGLGEQPVELIVDDDRSEAEWVSEELLDLAKHRPFKDFAILYRSNAQSRLFEEALRLRKVPYEIVGGNSFLERKEVKDLICYFRAILNQADDTAVRRIVNWPARGVGKAALELINQKALTEGWHYLAAADQTENLNANARAGIRQFQSVIHEFRRRLDQTPGTTVALCDWGRQVVDAIGFKQALFVDYEDPIEVQRRMENVDEVVNGMGQLQLKESPNLSASMILREYLSRLVLDNTETENEPGKEKEKNAVTLMTLHGAKGLEYPVVFLVGMEDGILPHQKVIDEGLDLSEERRLCYVGITRAKEKLYMSRARNRIKWGKIVPRNPSRFLLEIPSTFIRCMDRSTVPGPTDRQKDDAHEQKIVDFFKTMVDKM